MNIKRGTILEDKNTGRIVEVIKPATGNGHWNCKCGKKNHRLHEGTIKKFYKVKGE